MIKSTSEIDRETAAREALEEKLEAFAYRMRTVPRKAHKCELYGTVRTVVDIQHALAIFCKVFPGYKITRMVAYRALNVLQERLDEEAWLHRD